MPLVIPQKTPPRPPTGFDISQKPTFDELINVVRTQANYIQILVLYNEQLFTQLRDTANWSIVQQSVRNLVPDSDIKEPLFWTVGAGWAITDGAGIGGGRGFTLSASLPGTVEVISQPIAVPAAGGHYVLSGWLDLTSLQSGTVEWVAYDPVNLVDLAVVAGNAGESLRVQIGFDVAGIASLEVRLRSVDAVVSGDVIASQPQLELPGLGSAGVTAPEASLYRANVGVN